VRGRLQARVVCECSSAGRSPNLLDCRRYWFSGCLSAVWIHPRKAALDAAVLHCLAKVRGGSEQGATTAYGYTGDGLPETITQPGGGAVTRLGYDGFGHLTTITDALGQARTMEAEAAGRIRSMTDAAGAKTTFEYDAQGNRTAP